MPRAQDNRKPVGTENCTKCGSEAEFFQVQKGRYTGYLYRKGCECKADQRTLPFVQLEWLQRMNRTPHPMMVHPLTVEPQPREPATEPAPEKEPDEPSATGKGSGDTPTQKVSLFGLAAMAAAVIVATLT